jgi:thiol-disulfide isomerase/thioredoxin
MYRYRRTPMDLPIGRFITVVSMILMMLAGTVPVSESRAAWINDKAPGFSLSDFAGKPMSLGSLKGRIVFINFWASWCGPCKKETPELDKLAGQYSQSEVTVLAVNIDKTRENAEGFLDRLGLLHAYHFTVLLDPESSVVQDYGARAMPTSFIVDREGLIRFVHLGFNEGDPLNWRREIDSLTGKGGSHP